MSKYHFYIDTTITLKTFHYGKCQTHTKVRVVWCTHPMDPSHGQSRFIYTTTHFFTHPPQLYSLNKYKIYHFSYKYLNIYHSMDITLKKSLTKYNHNTIITHPGLTITPKYYQISSCWYFSYCLIIFYIWFI